MFSDRYIALEGLDTSGKTTASRKLKKTIESIYDEEVIVVNEPSYHSEEALAIRNELLNNPDLTKEQQLELFIKQRLLVMNDIVIPALKAGKIVISERCFITSMVYQSDESFGMQRILDLNLEALEQFNGLAIPSIVFLQENSHKVFLERSVERNLDVLEKPLADPAFFAKQADKYHAALQFAKYFIPDFNYEMYHDLPKALNHIHRHLGGSWKRKEESPILEAQA